MVSVIKVPLNGFTSLESAIHRINNAIADKDLTVRFIGYNKNSFLKGEIEIIVEDSQDKLIEIRRPSKFKQNATSQYYCVFKRGNGWSYKFVNKKISKKPFTGKIYQTELDAALAYDDHRYSVEGNIGKLNFPQHYGGDK